MARPREFDSQVALGRIKEVFWDQGYEATSISDLEEATGLARPRLYAAFGGKQDMLYKSIDAYLSDDIEPILDRVASGGVEAIAGWFGRFPVVRAQKPELALMGCLMVNSMVEFGEEDPEIVALRDRYMNRVAGSFRSALEKSQAREELHGDIESRVDMATLLLFGLFVSIRSGLELDRVKGLSDAASAEVSSWKA